MPEPSGPPIDDGRLVESALGKSAETLLEAIGPWLETERAKLKKAAYIPLRNGELRAEQALVFVCRLESYDALEERLRALVKRGIAARVSMEQSPSG